MSDRWIDESEELLRRMGELSSPLKDIQSKVKEKISTAEIRKIVLEDLRKRKPQWEQDWLIYERAVKKRTQ